MSEYNLSQMALLQKWLRDLGCLSLAHKPLSLHLLAQNTLTNYKLNDLFHYLTKVLSTMPSLLLFADTHSWVCFSMESQHSSHLTARDYLSLHFWWWGGEEVRHFDYFLASGRRSLFLSLPLPVKRLHWHCGSNLLVIALPINTQDLGVELYNWIAAGSRAGFGLNWPSREQEWWQSVSGSFIVQGGALRLGHAGPWETQWWSGQGV